MGAFFSLSWAYIFVGFFLVSLGQSAWVPFLAPFAAAIGYALFWKGSFSFTSPIRRFFLATFWFTAVQLVQLSWIYTTEYMGPLIVIVYLGMSLLIGCQFGILTFLFKKISLTHCLAVSGLWVLLEWSRHFFFTGFTWNPVGLSLASSPKAIQMAALFGVYGLSFWVIFTNTLALCAKRRVFWLIAAVFPYCFGWVHQFLVESWVPVEKTITALLVQPALRPEQKERFQNRLESYLPPLNQWEKIWESLETSARNSHPDLLVLPEAVVSISAYRAIYPFETFLSVWNSFFGAHSSISLPPLAAPLAKQTPRGSWNVSNAYIAQALANHYGAELIAGLIDEQASHKYNAALYFHPKSGLIQRIEKNILVPVSEYNPFANMNWLNEFLCDQFGIGNTFDQGDGPKILRGSLPMGICICVEETYGSFMRQMRLQGAKLFINISNDIWFPQSRLPLQHFQQGRLRAAENGVYVFRSCNTGVTGIIDCFGKEVATLLVSEEKGGALTWSVPLRSFPTLYTFWGDGAILTISLFTTFFVFLKKKLPLNM